MAHRMHIAVVFALLAAGASAQSPPADCTAAYSILSPCYSYVTGPETSPSSGCCAGLANLNSNQPTCLCSAITQLQASPTVNVTKALTLPRDCNTAIDTSKCPAFALPPSIGFPPPMMSPPMMSPPMASSPPPTMSPPMGATPPSVSAIPPTMGPVMGPSPPTGAMVPSPMMAPPMMTPSMAPSKTPEGSMVPTPMTAPPTVTPLTPGPGVPVTNGPISGPPAGPSQSAATAVSVSWVVFAAAAFSLLRFL